MLGNVTPQSFLHMSVQEKSPMPAETTDDKVCIWFIFLFYVLKFNTLTNNLCQEINFEEKKLLQENTIHQ